MAQDGLARAIRPIHSHVDGDVIFVVSTATIELDASQRLSHLLRLGSVAADCVTRAAARGVLSAEPLGGLQSYRSLLEQPI